MKHSFKITLFSVLTLMALLINALGVTPAQATASASETVTKTGVAGAAPDGGVGSQTIDWTVDYGLTSTNPLTNLTLNDTWSAGQTLVPGSVHTPAGDWSFSQPDSTSLTFTNALVAPGGKGSGFPIHVGLSGPVSFSGGGDGFNPALTTSGKVLGINHHISNAGIWCYDIAAGAVCPGYKMFPGINTSNNPFTRAIGNKIYIAGADSAGGNTVAGNIYCWDSDTESLCGTSPHIGAYDRMEVSNGMLYVLLATGEVDCYDPTNSLAECAGYPVQVNVPAYGGNVGNGLLPVGNSLYVLNYVGDLNCLNTSTLGFCTGWSSTPIDSPYANDLLFPRLSAAGAITGVCQAGAGTAATCYDLDGTNSVTVNGMAAVENGVYSYASDSTYFGSRVWFAGYGNNLGCWDWSTNDVCTGSGFDSGANPGKVAAYLGLPYGVTHDNFCLYTFGDAGALFSVDPISGETPCTQSGGETTVNIDDFYPDTDPGTVTATWDKIVLTNIDLTPGVDFNSLQVWVTDPDDTTVFGPTEMIGGSGTVDISSVSSSIRELTMHVQASLVSGATGINAKAWLNFASDTPVQFKFTYQTAVTCAGSSQSLTNTINTTLDPHSDIATVSGCGDTTAPDTSIDNQPTDPSNSSSAVFTFSGDDGSGSGVASYECQVDGGGYNACTSGDDFGPLSDGSHTFDVHAIDNAGNTDSSPASYTWTISTYVASDRLKNGGLNTYVGTSKTPKFWTSSNFMASDGKDLKAFPHKEGTATVKMTGASNVTKTLTQTLSLSGSAGDEFTFSFNHRSDAIPAAGICQGQVKLYNGTTLIETHVLNCAIGTHPFSNNTQTLHFTATGNYTKVVVQFVYKKSSGTVRFDAVSLLK